MHGFPRIYCRGALVHNLKLQQNFLNRNQISIVIAGVDGVMSWYLSETQQKHDLLHYKSKQN